MYAKGISSVIVEGGAAVLNSFLEEDLWDEARVFTSPKLFKDGIAAPKINANPFDSFNLESDLCQLFFNPKHDIFTF